MNTKIKKYKLLATTAAFAGLLCSCTDMDETYYSSVDPSHAPASVVVDGVIGQLRGLETTNGAAYLASEYVYFLEASTDEVIVPTRLLKDWYDNGKYIELQKHTWTPGNGCILSAWDCYYNIVSNCNTSLKQAETYGYSDNSKAQLRVLRAFAYSELLNNFGNVPLNLVPGESNTNSKKADVYNFLISELTDPIMETLPKKTTGQMNQAIRHSLLARLYLNSKVYLDLSDDDATYKANLQKCIDECEIVEGMGYSIASNLYDNFAESNETSTENIFTVSFDGKTTVGNYLMMLSHEHSLKDILGSANKVFKDCVNGICLNPGKTEDDPEAAFNIFDKDRDARFLSICWGQQYFYDKTEKKPSADSAYFSEYTDNFDTKDGKRHKFFTTYAPYFEKGIYGDVTQKINKAWRGDGARMMKYELTESQMWEAANDWVIVRLAEIKYMKAESLIRLGKASDAAKVLKEVLAHRGYDKAELQKNPKLWDKDGKLSSKFLMSKIGSTLPVISIEDIVPATPDLEFMDKEWRREFLFEGHRRVTMIRMGKFQGTWGLKNDVDAGTYTNLFPIPTVAIRNNALLHQNPGYEGYDGWLN